MSAGGPLRRPVGLSIGDRIRLAGTLHTVIAVSGTVVRLADTDGLVTDIGLAELSAAEDFEVVNAPSRPPVRRRRRWMACRRR